RRPRRISRAVPPCARDVGRVRRARLGGAERSGALRRGGGTAAFGVARRRPIRRRTRDADIARPLLATRTRLVDAAGVRQARGPKSHRQDDRTPLPPLRRLRGACVLALAHPRLGPRGLNNLSAHFADTRLFARVPESFV